MRNEGWEHAIDKYIADAASRPFEVGIFDCLIFVCDAIKLIAGIDPMAKKLADDPKTIRGAYRTPEEAKALIAKLRGDVANIMDVHFERIGSSFAQRGDVALHDDTFGLVWGRGQVLFKSPEALITRSISDMSVVWRVE
jgi:hypothetical protein